MSEFNKEVEDIKISDTIPINPNVHNLHNTMCFKTMVDMIISLPRKKMQWCCKTQLSKEKDATTYFDLDTLDLDFITNHPVLKERRFDLSGGVRNDDCKGCWKTEDLSGSSVRTEYNKNYHPIWRKRLENSKNHPKKKIQFHQEMQKVDLFHFIEIELTNKCNMACAYCWEGSSSRWQKETGIRFPDTEELLFNKVITILNEYWEQTLKRKLHLNFSLLGGEPFFTDHMFRFIEDFIVNINDKKRLNQKIVVTVTTNLNFPEAKLKKFLELVSRTPNIIYNMQLSGEAIGNKSEYVRWGLNWDNWLYNVDAFFENSKIYNNLILGFGCAHNSLTLPYFKDFLELIENKTIEHEYKQPIYMHTNWVDNPFPMSPAMIDPSHVNKIDEIIEYYDSMSAKLTPRDRYRNTLTTLRAHVLSDVNDEDKEKAYYFFKQLEDRRNISFSSVFPHYHELIKTDK